MNNNDNNDLKKHSALTTYKIVNGKKLKLSTYKAIQALYSKEQTILKEKYRTKILQYIDVFPNVDRENIMNNVYTDKTIEFTDETLNMDKLPDLVSTILQSKLDGIELLDKKSYDNRMSDINNSIIFKLSKMLPNDDVAILKLNNNKIILREQYYVSTFSNEDKNSLLNEIKNFCKAETIKASSGLQQLDYSHLAKLIDTNITRLKSELKEAVNTAFEFNYINTRNLDIDLKVAMLGSVKFITGKGNTFLEYQIPVEILKLLLLPKTFANIKSDITFKFKNEYAFNLYSFLKDSLYKKEIELSKQELFDFLDIPKKARESKYELQNRVLIPAITELEAYSDISVKYEFIPENKWRRIVFYISSNKNYVEDDKNFVRKIKENKKNYLDNERIVKAVEKARRNIYVSRAVNKNYYNKINNIYNQYGEDFIVLLLNNLYTSLNKNIETTLVQYLNGMIKNLKNEAKENKKRMSKKMFDTLLTKKIKEIDEDIIPEFKSELEVNLFLRNLPQNSLCKIQITPSENMKLFLGLKKMNKSDEFIKNIVDKFFEIKEDK